MASSSALGRDCSAVFCGRCTSDIIADGVAERVLLALGGLDRWEGSSVP